MDCAGPDEADSHPASADPLQGWEGRRRPRSSKRVLVLAVCVLGGILVTSLVLGALGFERNGNRTVGGPYIALPHDTNFTVRFNFSGPYAPPLNISGCPPGEARYDSNWSCAFTAWSNATWPSGACNSVNLVYVRGATETSIDPGVPEQVCPGHPQEFTVILYADPSTSGPIVANVLLLVS